MLGLGSYVGHAATHPDRVGVPTAPSDLGAQSISFVTADGVRLSGWFVPAAGARGQRPAVVLVPGRKHGREQLLGEIRALRDAGYATFSYDARGQGESGGMSSAGIGEQEDLRAAIDVLSQQPDVDVLHIGVVGHSLGGATAIMEAAHDGRVRAVVDEAGFASFQDALRSSVDEEVRTSLVAAPVTAVAKRYMSWIDGVDIDRSAPVDVAKDLHVPLLIIHARGDTEVSIAQSRRVLAATGSRVKRLWEVDGDHHATPFEDDQQGWKRNVLPFLNTTLGPELG